MSVIALTTVINKANTRNPRTSGQVTVPADLDANQTCLEVKMDLAVADLAIANTDVTLTVEVLRAAVWTFYASARYQRSVADAAGDAVFLRAPSAELRGERIRATIQSAQTLQIGLTVRSTTGMYVKTTGDQPASAAFVQGTGITVGGTSAAKAFTTNVTAGNAIAAMGASFNGTAATMTDDLSNTYVREVQSAVDARRTSGWKTYNITGGACTVTYTSSGSFNGLGIAEYSDIQTSSDPIDGTATQDDQTTPDNPATTGNITNTAAGMLSAVVQVNGASTLTSGTDWTTWYEDESFTNVTMNCQYRRVASSGSYDASWTLGTVAGWTTCGFSLKENVTAARFILGAH